MDPGEFQHCEMFPTVSFAGHGDRRHCGKCLLDDCANVGCHYDDHWKERARLVVADDCRRCGGKTACLVDESESHCADLQGDVCEGMREIGGSTTSAGCELVRRLRSVVYGRMHAGNETILSVECFLTWFAEVSVSGIDLIALIISHRLVH